MDGVSVAASIVGIATAGVQVSIKLVNLATQVNTAADRISSVANDISLTSGVLYQLGELMKQKTTDGGTTIFNQHGLETTKTSAAMCEKIFQEIDKETKKASVQLKNSKRNPGRMSGEKIGLSWLEKMKWPFVQPNIDILRAELRDAKSTLMLMLQVASLALNKRMFDGFPSTSEHEDYVRIIVALELQRREEQTNFTERQDGLGSSRSNDSHGTEPSRALRPETFVNVNSLGSNLHRSNNNSNVPGICPADSSYPSPFPNRHGEIQSHPGTELQMFLLKPEVIEFSDNIVLHWSLQDANMQQFAIHEHMAKNEKDGLPSVNDMLHKLHAYEQTMVESETSKVDGGSILSLKRTKTDIPCRDMLFKAVPGLQFVIQRQLRQARHPSPSSRLERAPYRLRPFQAPLRIQLNASSPPPEDQRPAIVPPGTVQYSRSNFRDSQEDKEAEALVTELLAKYTIPSSNLPNHTPKRRSITFPYLKHFFVPHRIMKR